MKFIPLVPPTPREFAQDAHDGQTRMDGSAKFAHADRVAATVARLLDSDALDDEYRFDMVTAALLHDVVEDTETTLAEIEALFGARVRELVDRVTRRPGETYNEFIVRCAGNPDAAIIKRADLADNISTLPFGDRRWRRYPQALELLNAVVVAS